MSEIPVIDLRGTPREIGRGHGEALRDRIASALGIYSIALARSEAGLREAGATVAARVRSFSPDLVAFLADRADETHPIGRAYAPLDLVPGVEVGTVATVAMELAEARRHVRRGPDPAAPLQQIDARARV